MQLYLKAPILGDALGNRDVQTGWIAFLDCTESDFRTRFYIGDPATLNEAISQGRIMFREPSQSRPEIRDFEVFLSQHGFTLSWKDFAEMGQYHRSEAEAVIERAQEDEVEGFENLELIS